MPYTFKTGEDLTLLEQEEKAVLTSFNSKDAWKLGNIAIQIINSKYPKGNAVVDITLNDGHKLFRSVVGGETLADNDDWVVRKGNVVKTYNHSSFYVASKLQLSGKPLLNDAKFASHGGAFPIRLAGCPYSIGVFTVSGLAQHEDHDVVYKSLLELAELQSAT